MSGVLQLAEFLGASWLLWRLSARCYRPGTPRDARGVDDWPVESAEPTPTTGVPTDVRAPR